MLALRNVARPRKGCRRLALPYELFSDCGIRPSCCIGPKASSGSRMRRSCHPPCGRQSDNALKVRFSATLGEEPKIELGLV